MLSKQNLLMIFAKLPEPGKVKTRLAKVIGNEEAAGVYKQLVKRVAEQVAPPPTQKESWATWVIFDPPGSEPAVREWLEPLFLQGIEAFLAQVSGGLGDRLGAAFVAGFEAGFEKVAAIGTDCPHLDARGISACWESLEQSDVVFGPADDGGYYLIGMRENRQELFQDVPWSSDQTLPASLAVAERIGAAVDLLDELSDVDEVEQWEALKSSDPRWSN